MHDPSSHRFTIFCQTGSCGAIRLFSPGVQAAAYPSVIVQSFISHPIRPIGIALGSEREAGASVQMGDDVCCGTAHVGALRRFIEDGADIANSRPFPVPDLVISCVFWSIPGNP